MSNRAFLLISAASGNYRCLNDGTTPEALLCEM